MDLSDYYDAFWYVGAAVVAYYAADIFVCKGCVRADGRVNHALMCYTALFLLRAFWAATHGGRVDWDYEAYYWRNVSLGVAVGVVYKAWVLKKKERARVAAPPPEPARQPGRRGRRGRGPRA
ncbi:unnamed protein product [Urochloa humidicola]